jgi:Tfp pilus assembly protein PilF
MTRSILAASLAFLGSVSVSLAWPQSQPLAGQALLDDILADLRGQREIFETSTTRNVISFSPTATPMISTVRTPVRESVGTVSAQRLRHRPPKAAQKAHEEGDKLLKKKDLEKAAQELERAIALDPDYAEAHNDLGVAYTRLGRYPEAMAELRRAIEMIPGESVPYSNLAGVLFLSGQRDEAEVNARRAIRLSPNNAQARLVLGRLLLDKPDARAEALDHLKYAAKTMPEVKQVLKASDKK